MGQSGAFSNHCRPRARSSQPCIGSEEAQLLVMEDLGPSSEQLLGNLLDGDDPDRAGGRFARSPARTGSTPCRDDRPAGHLRALPGSAGTDVGRAIGCTTSLTTSWRFRRCWPARASCSRLRPSVRSPTRSKNPLSGPFLAFTHGDPTIGNVFIRDGEARLIDLETGEFRHALVDGSFARLRYLHSVWARRLPFSTQRRMLEAYRGELVYGCPALRTTRGSIER